MTIKLYNTMSRKVEEFKPLIPGHVGFYSCGPTVYHYAHIGNLRAYIHADILKRMFIENGFDVKHIMNLTDVGHLTSDEDSGEDKMEKGAKRENKSVWDIAKMYTDAFFQDTDALNIIRPTFTPKATDYISEQIEQVKKLEKLGYTYEIPGDGIYYDTSKFAAYGALGGQNLNELRAGARINENDNKKNPTDFALWKFSPTGTKRAMEWDSPWGRGFPGWHIECSAMSSALLGDHFDIHTGGIDHVKIHHTNEIAQSEPLIGKPWVNYWVHFEFLIEKNTQKMSKSNGEFLTLSVLQGKGYDPITYKYLILLGHYSQQIEFSFEALDAATNGYKNIIRKVSETLKSATDNTEVINKSIFELWHKRILDTISDNLKTAETLVIFQELLKDNSVNPITKIELFKFVDRLLGLQFLDRAQKLLDSENIDVPSEIQKLADARTHAKFEKNWALSDELRNQIDAAGWNILDTKDGIKIIKKMS